MKEISDVTACVVDSGLFLPLAHCMAEKCKRTLYWSPDVRAFPSVKQACIGDGFSDIERVRDFWSELNDIDLFVFPDIGQAALQAHLKSIGKSVWGSGDGDVLELNREKFMRVLAKVGLDVPEFEVVVGWTNLRHYLQDQEDCYIKISRYRGDMETTHWRSWSQDENWINWLAVNFGSVKEHIRFLVFKSIDTDLEIGGDTYCVGGRFPDKMLNGLEWKDKSYFSAVTPTGEMPDQLIKVMDAFVPFLTEVHYTNQWSMEVRVQDDKAYFIDATTRGGMPSSGSQQLIWSNFPEIIWAGSNGELVQPEPAAQFSIECMITSKCGKDLWDEVEIDPELIPWARFSSCAYIDGRYCFPPDEFHEGELGWLVALGDTPAEVLARIKCLADLLPDGLNADVEALAGVIKEIDQAKEEGIPFTDQPVPDPATVIED
jgi:hypothetical protein